MKWARLTQEISTNNATLYIPSKVIYTNVEQVGVR